MGDQWTFTLSIRRDVTIYKPASTLRNLAIDCLHKACLHKAYPLKLTQGYHAAATTEDSRRPAKITRKWVLNDIH